MNDGKENTMMQQSIEVKNPATGDVLETISRDERQQIEEKLQSGNQAFRTWKKTNVHERSNLLMKWSHLIQENKQSIAHMMTKENGKPLKESLGEVDYATSYIDWYAEEGKRAYGRTIPTHADGKRLLINNQPNGPEADITAWNLPAAMMTRKAAPALAAGCTFIVKTAEETPLTMIRLTELAHEAGFPKD